MLTIAALLALSLQAEPPGRAFVEKHCLDCHDGDAKKGGLDLEAAALDPAARDSFETWVKVHDRVRDGEMPPKKRKKRPSEAEVKTFLAALAPPLAKADRDRGARHGRSTWRRLNRFEYENSVRDLLGAPWLEVKEILPEDGELHRFNKVGDALDISHVQMAQYLKAADHALRDAMARDVRRPKTKKVRYYARDMPYFQARMFYNPFNRSPERATFPVLGHSGQPDVRAKKAPMTVGPSDPETREREAAGVVASSYEPLEPRFDGFEAPMTGRYRIRLSALSVWVGPQEGKRWYRPDINTISKGRRSEPVKVYAQRPPRQIRHLGEFDATPDVSIGEFDVYLVKGETIRVDAARLFRSRPPGWHNPLAEKDGQPGVAFRWLEVEGPIFDAWPTEGHRLLFGGLPMRRNDRGTVEVESKNPEADAERLMHGFVARAYRRPAPAEDVTRFLSVVRGAMKTGSSFTDAMVAGYTTVLCSPGFLCLEERPGALDGDALASRLAYFLWNSPPDADLRAAASKGALDGQVDRLLDDPRSARFVDAFLDYWLDLRYIHATSPDAALYPDYYLDDLLVESAVDETRAFFTELLRENLPARNIIDSDFLFVNERLSRHYGLAPVEGVKLRKVARPDGSPRGGLLTHASVLKVSANGTTTSPVLRGVWVMERILGEHPPPPPPSVPAIEPDTRGATTIREQLDKHREVESCAACHVKIDPAGFALENFDVLGGWREKYRALGDRGEKVAGYGKNGQAYTFRLALPVDAAGTLPDGRSFKDVKGLKRLLLEDERKIARNLVRQLVVYATGAPVRFGDRAAVESILDRVAGDGFRVQSIVREIVRSDLFKRK